MSISMMIEGEKAKELGLDHPDIKVIHNYPGAESGRVCHHLDCPNCPEEDKAKAKCEWNNEKHPQEKYPIRENCHNKCRVTEPLYMHTTYRGCVLSTYERNGRDDSDFFAVVWDEYKQSLTHVEYATTRGWTYPNEASIDVTNEVKIKANEYLKKIAKKEWDQQNIKQAATPKVGKQIQVKKGRKVKIGTKGKCFWYGEGKKYNSRIEKPMRVGFKDIQGNTYWTDVNNVEVINPEQYLQPDIRWSYMNSNSWK